MTPFVWLYKHDAKHADDLFLSMLSVHRFYQGEPCYIVVGDKPEWFVGTHVPCAEATWASVRRSAVTAQRVRYVDTMKKMELWCRSHTCEFVWMMDDQVFIRPFAKSFFYTRLFQEPIEKPVKPWEKLVTMTMRRFVVAKHYSTHFPQMFDSQKMLDVYEALDMPNKLFLFDCAYGNFWKERDVLYRGIGRRITKNMPRQTIDLAFLLELQETVLNWDDTAFQFPAFKQFLKERVCSMESQFGPLPFASSMQISSLWQHRGISSSTTN